MDGCGFRSPDPASEDDARHLRLALRLARHGRGATSPNPMVGAVLVAGARVIGQGWHHRAGEPHAEIEALNDARRRGHSAQGATLYVTLEPCSTCGRTPPCTDAILQARLARVVAGAEDPNPRHRGRAFQILKEAGIATTRGLLAEACEGLNPAFNHWIVHRTPWVTVKAAMTMDGKIATADGQSKWITGDSARRYGMRLRQDADAILVGIRTVLADDPRLTVRPAPASRPVARQVRRIVLDSRARTPLNSNLLNDPHAALTTIVVGERAPKKRIAALERRVRVLIAPIEASMPGASNTDREVGRAVSNGSGIDLALLLRTLGAEDVTSLLVEGGGEVNASFLLGGFAHRVAFFYAPKILGGKDARPAVGGTGVASVDQTLDLIHIRWRKLGEDWLLVGSVSARRG